ncbi:cobalt-precorrin-7 (C(5))-methyltransferase [Lentilactobacillus raoultii]|uniref:Cobalt-precorrin-7 (C(5))-methyltransferase n=1 Tax=Lentilactobacillus raoultii TaxID=1987503 RepID=A0ABW3PE91_9LACO|nr:cobalt-precorrin-7 (C(5))-methyltransferase [Lentilactobacillus raoultii]
MIIVLGIGPGSDDLMINGSSQYLEEAETLIGSSRQLALFPTFKSKAVVLPKLKDLEIFLKAHIDKKIVILASGDPLLYGIGNWVIKKFPGEKIQIVPGISAIQYFFHRLKFPMNDVYLTSSHGQVPDFDFLLQHTTIGMVTDQVTGPYEIAQEIKKRGQHRQVFIGEMLSYPDEKISVATELTVKKRNYQMNVVIITNA